MKDVKDWTGNYHSIYTTLGASNHALSERAENDYYATEPRAVELLLEQEKFAPVDFLSEMADGSFDGDIITNPPYKYALGFLEQAIKVIKPKAKVAMFLKLTFLEGKKRREFFEKNPPKIVYVSSARLSCAKNGEFEKYPSSAAAYAWFVWEKGFKGEPVIKWIN